MEKISRFKVWNFSHKKYFKNYSAKEKEEEKKGVILARHTFDHERKMIIFFFRSPGFLFYSTEHHIEIQFESCF